MKALIDELGALEYKLAPKLAEIKPDVDRVKELKAQISAATPAGEQVVHGLFYGASVGKNGTERAITSMPRLFRSIGQGAFLATCGFALGKFDDLVKRGTITKTDAAVLISETETGPRTVKTFNLPHQKAVA